MTKLSGAESKLKVFIVGHTDNQGSLEGNRELAKQRANSVATALLKEYKVDPSRLRAEGVASLAPVASNADEGGRARNRRVELVVQ
jgi:OOP family OmpA-OmpF porin